MSEQATLGGLSFELELPKFQAHTKRVQLKRAKGEQSQGRQKEQRSSQLSKESIQGSKKK